MGFPRAGDPGNLKCTYAHAFRPWGGIRPRSTGLELGIDDCVVKPFSPKELMMRVAAIVKRSSGETQKGSPFL